MHSFKPFRCFVFGLVFFLLHFTHFLQAQDVNIPGKGCVITYPSENSLRPEHLTSWMQMHRGLLPAVELIQISTDLSLPETKAIVYAYQINGIKVSDKRFTVLVKNNWVHSISGDIQLPGSIQNKIEKTPAQAVSIALQELKAKRYKWENSQETAHMQAVLQDSKFTFEPQTQEVYFEFAGSLHRAYEFSVYAEIPLSKTRFIIDAATGSVLLRENLLCTVDVPALALTKFSGTQSITCDNTGSLYRLRETQRGLGIETYNCNNTTTYAANDFTNASTSWSLVNNDQIARDAHWGAEKTYDYYFTQHNRNSIDNNGFKLLSYVHYNTNYNNAFWDGLRMTYGDGNGTAYTHFAAIDVCGHEVTHGLTSNTGNLNYSYESGALNESFSDIFGTLIEQYARPNNWNWKMGEQVTLNGNGLRNMSNPNQFNQPDTYLGTNWFTGTADNGGVHTNSGVGNFWFYLLSTGGSGTNDINQSYSVTPIGMSSAARIAFRALTVYFTPTTNYAMARALTVKSAADLFGACSNEVIQTMNAWHAVGVGAAYNPASIAPNFTANITSFCSLPAQVTFSNTTAYAQTYTWYFGDGTSSNSINPMHTYSANGSYTVKLKASGCQNLQDSIIKNAFITIAIPSNPLVQDTLVCGIDSILMSAQGSGTLKWFVNSQIISPMAIGNTVQLPLSGSLTTYFVANTFSNAPVTGGRLINSGGSYLINSQQWQVFDVWQACTLNSVVVYANSAGTRSIELRNSSNAVLATTTASLSVGPNTVALNFHLNPGSNYQLGLNAASLSDLYRSNTGNYYPYNIGSCISITGSSAGPGFYYWFYSWNLTKDDCSSPRIPVNITKSSTLTLQLSASATLVCVNDAPLTLNTAPPGGTLTGAGVVGAQFVPPNGPGTYSINYMLQDASGCTASQSLIITADACTSLKQDIQETSIYPQPVCDQLNISGLRVDDTLILLDITGKQLFYSPGGNQNLCIDTRQWAKGCYLIQIHNPLKGIKTYKCIKSGD